MKKLLTILASLTLILSLSLPALAVNHEGEIGICLDGNTYYPSSLPVQVQNGRTMVPLRDLAERLGADVEWVQETQEIVMIRAGSTVTMTLGKTTADVDGTAVEMDVAPYAVDGHTLIPARYVAEFFGQVVTWDQENSLVVVEEDKSVAGDSNLEAWALAMGAMRGRLDHYGAGNGSTHFGQVPRCDPMITDVPELFRYRLELDWGIHDREELIAVILSMTFHGHNDSFQEAAAIANSLTDAEMEALIAQSSEVDAYMWPYTKALSEKWGEKGILAWDLFRMSNLVQWGYSAGYLTYAEALALVEPAAALLCETFSSWEEAYENYLWGAAWWERIDVEAFRTAREKSRAEGRIGPLDDSVENAAYLDSFPRGSFYIELLANPETTTLFDNTLFSTGVIGLPQGAAGSLDDLGN